MGIGNLLSSAYHTIKDNPVRAGLDVGTFGSYEVARPVLGNGVAGAVEHPLDTVHGIYSSTQVGAQPGVGTAPAVNPALLQPDPVTHLYYDPTTGRSYLDAAGTQIVTDPNVAQQVATNVAKANALWAALPAAQQQQQQAYRAQTRAANGLGDVISGVAPSVAQSQLGAGVDAIAANANAMAAGHTGENAALSHIQAMRSASDAQ